MMHEVKDFSSICFSNNILFFLFLFLDADMYRIAAMLLSFTKWTRVMWYCSDSAALSALVTLDYIYIYIYIQTNRQDPKIGFRNRRVPYQHTHTRWEVKEWLLAESVSTLCFLFITFFVQTYKQTDSVSHSQPKTLLSKQYIHIYIKHFSNYFY